MSPSLNPAEPSKVGLTHGVTHYENFPVASWLCPAHLRAPIAAIYWFARTADDLADEGAASAAERLDDLAAYGSDLEAVYAGRPFGTRWSDVFKALSLAIEAHRLPQQLLADLLDAFVQDVRYTESGHRYASNDELRQYCSRSANPVGRLLLHLYGITDPNALDASDHVCTALQLINFWQDLGADVRRRRFYLPLDACNRHGLSHAQMQSIAEGAPPLSGAINLISELVANASAEMQKGSRIVHQVPGRAGWELRAVVQGGLTICRRIQAQGFNTFHHRPTLRKRDVPALLWRTLWM